MIHTIVQCTACFLYKEHECTAYNVNIKHQWTYALLQNTGTSRIQRTAGETNKAVVSHVDAFLMEHSERLLQKKRRYFSFTFSLCVESPRESCF